MSVERCKLSKDGGHNYVLTGMAVETEKGKCAVTFCTRCLDRQELVIVPKSAIVQAKNVPQTGLRIIKG